MLKKLLLAAVTLIASMGFAFAQVDVNKADQAALDGVKGIGPKMSKAILDERKKGGEFKDWVDFEKRVKGVGDKSSEKLSQAGLTVNGQGKSNASASASASAAAAKVEKKEKSASASASASAKVEPKKAETKKDEKPAPASASASASVKK